MTWTKRTRQRNLHKLVHHLAITSIGAKDLRDHSADPKDLQRAVSHICEALNIYRDQLRKEAENHE